MLNGMRVIEFADGIAGPSAGLHLAELGADVIKLEEGEGDWSRGAAAAMSDGSSTTFHALNRGKRSVALGSSPDEARPLMQALLRTADVLITDRTPEELSPYGIDASGDLLFPANSRLITCVISPWGRRGPLAGRKGSELTSQAMSGYTRYLGSYGKPACRLGADVGSLGSGLFALQGILAAIYSRNRTNKGQRVDISLVNSLLAMKSIHLAAQSDPDAYEGPRVGGANHTPERGWKTADRPIYLQFGGSVGPEGKPGWVNFIKEVGLDHTLDDPRCDKGGRKTTGHGLYTHEFREDYEKAFKRYTAEQITAIVKKHGGNAAIYIDAKETLAHPQTQALDIVRTAPGRKSGESHQVRAFPARFSRLKPKVPGVAPEIGEHTQAVAAQAGIDEKVLALMTEQGGLKRGAG